MRMHLFKPAAILMALGLILNACKKNDPTPATTPNDTPTQSQQTSDVSGVNTSLDQALNDANNYISGTAVSGRQESGCSILNYTGFGVSSGFKETDSSYGKVRIYKLVHSNITNCLSNLIINGTLIISFDSSGGKRWSKAGAEMTLTFINYSVTKPNGDKFVFNGSKTITNLTGGLIATMAQGASVSHVIQTAGTALSITFPDGTVRSWGTHRERTWTNNGNGGYSYTMTGLGSASETGTSYNSVAYWGINRAGNNFATVVSQPIVFNSYCPFSPISGQEIHYASATITATYGVDASGNPVSYTVGSTCPWGMKINWTNSAGTAETALVQY